MERAAVAADRGGCGDVDARAAYRAGAGDAAAGRADGGDVAAQCTSTRGRLAEGVVVRRGGARSGCDGAGSGGGDPAGAGAVPRRRLRRVRRGGTEGCGAVGGGGAV